MNALPDYYTSPLHLPFNTTCLNNRFRIAPPDAAATGTPCWVLLRGGELVYQTAADGPVLPVSPKPPLPLCSAALHIGSWDGQPCQAAAVSRQTELPAGWSAESLAAPEPRLPIELLTLGATAGQILHWERHSSYCAGCGGQLERIPATWGKRCPACGAERFPHIHPCAIVVVRRAGEVLLARKAGWPPGRYGLVAGFVDFGEALEETVVREVLEETGIRVRDVRYIGSQAWPFPSQLMAGFTAEYAGGEVRVDPHELEDARWFSLDALPDLPPKRSIARYLIDHHARGA